MTPPTRAGSAPAERRPFLEVSRLGWPEVILCVEGPILLASLFFLPWFSATGNGEIHGHHGNVTGWETYGVLRYFLLWCGVGSFILPWIIARGHELSWPRGQLTMVHGVTGFVLLVLNGLGFRPGEPSSEIHIEIGYVVGLAAMVAATVAGAWRAHLSGPPIRKPPGMP